MSILVWSAGAWRDSEPFLRHDGLWKQADTGDIFDAGLWKEFYSGKTLITETLSGSSWTCPAGVTSIAELVGRGGSGGSATWSGDENIVLVRVTPFYTGVRHSSYFENLAQSEYAKFPTNFAGKQVSYRTHRFDADGQTTSSNSGYYRSRHGIPSKTGWGVDFTTPIGGLRLYTITRLNLRTRNETRGASTSGFGQTFQGGLGGAATQRTVNNIPVTPGQTYQISIASGGLLRITYLG